MDELLKELNDINALAQIRADYAKTLVLLRVLKEGRVSLDDVTLVDGGWTVSAKPVEGAIKVADEPPAEPPVEPQPE